MHRNLTSVGLFDPMSAPRYAWTESADTTWPDRTAIAAMVATTAAQRHPHPLLRLAMLSTTGLMSSLFVSSLACSSSSSSSTSSTPLHVRRCLTDNSEAKHSKHSNAAMLDLPTAVGPARTMTSRWYQCHQCGRCCCHGECRGG